jgi:hypothetical protein
MTKQTPFTPARWLRTPDAVLEMGVSSQSLKRWRDVSGGFLIVGIHWRTGGSSLLWEANSVALALHHRGLQRRQERLEKRQLEAAGRS